MRGLDHALSGAAAFAAAAPLVNPSPATFAVCALLAAGAGTEPDIDEPGSTIGRSCGYATSILGWAAHRVSGGHRKGTHSLLGVAAVTGLTWLACDAARPGPAVPWWHYVPAGALLAILIAAALGALRLFRHADDIIGTGAAALLLWLAPGTVLSPVRVHGTSIPLLAFIIAIGALAHIAGDMVTHHGCPLLYPFSRHCFGLLPKAMRITTDKLAERWVVTPLLTAALIYLTWRDVTALPAAHIHMTR